MAPPTFAEPIKLVIPPNRSLTDYSQLGPYLQFKHVVSQIWLAAPIISIVFIIFRLQLSSAAAQDAVNNVKLDLLAACKAAEHAATSAASMPRYLAASTNEQVIHTINHTLNGARATMILALDIIEAIVNFAIDCYRSTWFCIAELVIRSCLSLAIVAVNGFNSALSSLGKVIHDEVENSIGIVQKILKTAINIYNNTIGLFGSDVDMPNLNPDLSALENLQLPAAVSDKLNSMEQSLPNTGELKDMIESIVDKPFELLKKEINDTFNGFKFDSNALPVPGQNTIVFCDQMDTSFVDKFGDKLEHVALYGIGILLFIVFVLLGLNFMLKRCMWRRKVEHLQALGRVLHERDARYNTFLPTAVTQNTTVIQSTHNSYPDHQLMQMETMIEHPLTVHFARRLNTSSEATDRWIWFFRYILHPPAVACLVTGVCGLISVEIQLLVIHIIQHNYSQDGAFKPTDFTQFIANSVNATMYEDSAKYANAVNAHLDSIQSTINHNVFGWVDAATSTLSKGLDNFYSQVQNTAHHVFGNSLLDGPVQDFIHCFLGSQIEAYESTLDWLQKNLHVDIPHLDPSILILSSDSVNEAVQPVAQAAVGTGENDTHGFISRIVAVYVEALEKERIMFALIAGLWFVVVLMGLVICLCSSCRHRGSRALHHSSDSNTSLPSREK